MESQPWSHAANWASLPKKTLNTFPHRPHSPHPQIFPTCKVRVPPPPHPFRKLTRQLPISQSFLSLQKIRCLITLRSRDLITAHLELFSLRYSPSFYYAVMLVLTLELSNAQLRMLRMSRETIVRKWFIFLNDIHDHQYLEICSAFSLKRMAYQYV